ncbi:MAG: Crp/Fnr family transcriptional regulator [Rhodospirillales bacterium]|nr:Crp/Fnr family transcriptional regulator [Rhodospirillales bacterium]
MREYSLGVLLDLDQALSSEHLRRLVFAGTRQQHAKHEYLYRQGDPADHVHLLLSGRVKSYLVSSSGHEALLRIHLPGSLVGLTAVGSRRRRDASAVALETIETVMIIRPKFLALLAADARLGILISQLLIDRLSDFHFRVGEMFTGKVEQRLARALVALSRPRLTAPAFGTELRIALTHEELAHLINARRPTVTAALARFAQAGLIRKDARRIEVCDPKGLLSLLPDIDARNVTMMTD